MSGTSLIEEIHNSGALSMDQLTIASISAPEKSLVPDSGSATLLRQQIRINQAQANKRSIGQYGKQRSVRVFDENEKVSVAAPKEDRASTDGKRVFGYVLEVIDKDRIQTKYGVLERCYPTSELMPLPDTVDLDIPEPRPTQKITLHHIPAKESTFEQLEVQCGCKDQKTWCSTRRCACFKEKVHCSIACHG